MPKPRLPYLQKETSRHGKTVWYFRRGAGPRIRLRGDYGSSDFRAAYDLALSGHVGAGRATDAPQSIGWLCARYRESADWRRLAAGTHAQREGVLRSLPASAPISAVTRKAIIQGMDRRAATPHQANTFLRTLIGLFQWAVYAGHVRDDPTRGVKKLLTKKDGFHVWTDDECRRFESFYPVGTRERLAFDLLLYTGLRRSDAVRVGPQHIRDGVLRFRTAKGGVSVGIPLPHALASCLANTEGQAFIVMKASSFGVWFGKAAKVAGCPGSAHGLRKASATRMAEAGASTSELKAYYGWTTNAMPEHYTKTAEREGLARQGAGRVARNINNLSGAPEPGAGG